MSHVNKPHSLPPITLANGQKLELFVAELDTGAVIVEVHAHESVLEDLDVRTVPSNVREDDWIALGAELRRKDPALFARLFHIHTLAENVDEPAKAVEAMRAIVAEVH